MTEPPQQPDQPDPPEPQETQETQEPQETTVQFDEEPPAPPRKSNAGVITAIVVGAALVLGGAGTGLYFLTKDDAPANTATGTSQPHSATQPAPTTATSEVSGAPPTQNSDKAPPIQVTTTTPPPKPPEGGGGGGGNGADDAGIIQVAQKYAKAVTAKDEAAAKSATCENETGLLYNYAQKVEVTGKPEKYGDDNANIFVRITVEGTEPIDDFPLFMDKKNNAWCISS